MDIDTICPVCQRFDEDGSHLLLKCKHVKKLWRELQLEDYRKSWVELTDPRTLVEEILQLNHNTKILCISLCWNWWNTRNKLNAEGKAFTHNQVMAQIRRSALEFQDFFSKPETTTATPFSFWKPPSSDIIKLNIDGSFLAGEGRGGLGFVARDADGDVCISGVGSIEHAQDALHTEAEACIQSMLCAQRCGMHNIQIETGA
jgi:hypothetical protein